MASKINQNPQFSLTAPPKFADSMVEIMDIIKHRGGLDEVIKESSDKRKFKSGKITFTEMDGKNHGGKKTVAE